MTDTALKKVLIVVRGKKVEEDEHIRSENEINAMHCLPNYYISVF